LFTAADPFSFGFALYKVRDAGAVRRLLDFHLPMLSIHDF
jgi:hypothetical protein